MKQLSLQEFLRRNVGTASTMKFVSNDFVYLDAEAARWLLNEDAAAAVFDADGYEAEIADDISPTSTHAFIADATDFRKACIAHRHDDESIYPVTRTYTYAVTDEMGLLSPRGLTLTISGPSTMTAQSALASLAIAITNADPRMSAMDGDPRNMHIGDLIPFVAIGPDIHACLAWEGILDVDTVNRVHIYNRNERICDIID